MNVGLSGNLNKIFSVILLIPLMLYDINNFAIPIILGFIIYHILYTYRYLFYRFGLSRFFIYASIFYLSAGIQLFFLKINDQLNLIEIFRSIHFSFNSLFNLDFNFNLNFSLIPSALAIAGIVAVINIEFISKDIKSTDMASYKMTMQQQYSYNYNIQAIVEMLGCVVTICYSVPLGLIMMVYFLLTEVLIENKTRIIIDVFICLLLLACVILKFSMDYYYITSKMLAYIRSLDSLSGIVRLEIKNPSYFIIKNGFPIFAIPLLLARISTNLKFITNYQAIVDAYREKPKTDIVIKDGVFIGYNFNTHKKVILSDIENNQHTLISGTTGAGKTVAIMNYVNHCAIQGFPCLFIDGKGSLDLVYKMRDIATKHGRKFKFFTLKPHLMPADLKPYLSTYNPFASGTATEWKNRLMSMFVESNSRGQQHYVLQEEKYINLIVNIIHSIGGNLDLYKLYKLIKDPNLLLHLATKTNNQEFIQGANTIIDGKDTMTDIVTIIELFIMSSYGEMFDTTKNKPIINVKDSIIDGEIVLFLLESSGYKVDTHKVAKMIINDINSSFSELVKPVKSYCIFDEFASYASSNLSDTISLQRSNGMHAVIGTQSVTTVGLKDDETARIAEELLACCNTYICMQTNHDKDIERFANIFGTRSTYEITTQLDMTDGGGTGLGSSRSVDNFLVHPRDLRNISVGEGYIYRKALGQKPFKIKINNVFKG